MIIVDDAQRVKGLLETRKGIFTYEYYLYYFKDIKVNTYSFDIWDENDLKPFKYSFILEILENGQDLKVMDLFAGDYQGMGISIPIILKAKELFGKRIISSSNANWSRPGESNWEEAIEKVWEPMVNQGLAEYRDNDDRYYVL